MAVVSIHEIWKGRGMDGSTEGDEYTRVFRIWTNSGADDGYVVAAALAGSPWFIFPGAVHPSDSRAFCVASKPQNDLGNKGWIAVATYTTKNELAQDPEDDTIEISWDEEDLEVPVTKDRNNKAVLNSAGDPPDPPVMASDSMLICNIEAKVAALPAYMAAFRKSINSGSFTVDGYTVAAKHGRLRRIKLGKQKYRGSYPYRDVSLEIAILDADEDDWELRFLDAGFRKIVTVGASIVRDKIVNGDGTDPTQPVPLDGAGLPIEDPTLDNAVFIEVPYYRLKDFTTLPGCS